MAVAMGIDLETGISSLAVLGRLGEVGVEGAYPARLMA